MNVQWPQCDPTHVDPIPNTRPHSNWRLDIPQFVAHKLVRCDACVDLTRGKRNSIAFWNMNWTGTIGRHHQQSAPCGHAEMLMYQPDNVVNHCWDDFTTKRNRKSCSTISWVSDQAMPWNPNRNSLLAGLEKDFPSAFGLRACFLFREGFSILVWI